MPGIPKDMQAPPHLSAEIYGALRMLAQRHLARERRDHTLQPTALVHEAYLRLGRRENGFPIDSAQFQIAAASAMRRILVDHARRRATKKRGHGSVREHDAIDQIQTEDRGIDVLDMNEALEHLREMDQQLASVVELRYFGGLADTDIAEILGCSTRNVRRAWRAAQLWLAQKLRP